MACQNQIWLCTNSPMPQTLERACGIMRIIPFLFQFSLLSQSNLAPIAPTNLCLDGVPFGYKSRKQIARLLESLDITRILHGNWHYDSFIFSYSISSPYCLRLDVYHKIPHFSIFHGGYRKLVGVGLKRSWLHTFYFTFSVWLTSCASHITGSQCKSKLCYPIIVYFSYLTFSWFRVWLDRYHKTYYTFQKEKVGVDSVFPSFVHFLIWPFFVITFG